MATTRRELLGGAAGIAAATWLPAPTIAQAAPGDAAAAALLAQTAEALLAEFPDNACYLGIDKGARAALHGRLTDRTAAAGWRRTAAAAARLAALHQVDRARLSPAMALHVDVAQEAHALAVEGRRTMPVGTVETLNFNYSFRNTPYTVSQLAGAYSDLPDLLENKHAVREAADADAFLARLGAMAAAIDGESDRILGDAAAGAILPGFLNAITVGQVMAARAGAPEALPYIAAFRAKCAAAGLSGRYAAEAARLAGAQVYPALDRQAAALAKVRPAATDTPGIWAIPQGEDYYRWLVKAGTTTAYGPDALHAMGLEMNAKLTAEMDGLLKAQGLTRGSVAERMIGLSTRPDLLFADDDGGRAKLLAYLQGRIDDVRARLPRAFGTLVKGNLQIRRVPPAIQDGAPNGYAGPGSMDGSVPGIYYINLKTTGIWPRYALPTLCYHEGIPGHIWQGEYSYALPLVRSLLAFNAYSEGWALYAEQLGDELGAYDGDPLGRLGYLQSINFRACRLVVDTGLHHKRWSFSQALDWMRGATGMPVAQLTAELQRYCAIPGQACGYKMGHNQINMARLRAQTMLGQRYDLRAFDDVVVKAGNVPLTLLDRVVDGYIAATRD